MQIDVVSPIDVEAEVHTYTLVSDDIYTRRYDSSTIPTWYRSLLGDIIKGDSSITNIQGAIDFLTLQGTGYNQSIVNLQTVDSSTNASLTTLTSQVGSNTAGIGTLQVTKVDSTQATAIAQTVVGSAFGTGGISTAWFSSNISTYASNIAANASSISTLQASLGNTTVRIDDINYVSLDPITGYKLGASKIGTAPDGSITGWQFMNGTGIQSTFKVKATNFSISDGTTGYTPFSIAGSNVKFDGVVDFTNTNAFGTTTINGSKITTGSITTGQIAANTITSSKLSTNIALINGYIASSDFTTIGGAGFRLKSDAAGTSADPTIYGAYIKSSILDTGTLSFRDLTLLTDGGYPTSTTVFANGVIDSTTQIPRAMSGGWLAYAASNNNGSNLLCVRLSSIQYQLLGDSLTGHDGVSYTVFSPANYDSSVLVTFCGITGSITTPTGTSYGTYTTIINGVRFALIYYSGSGTVYFGMQTTGYISSFTSASKLPIAITGFGATYVPTMIIYNI